MAYPRILLSFRKSKIKVPAFSVHKWTLRTLQSANVSRQRLIELTDSSNWRQTDKQTKRRTSLSWHEAEA